MRIWPAYSPALPRWTSGLLDDVTDWQTQATIDRVRLDALLMLNDLPPLQQCYLPPLSGASASEADSASSLDDGRALRQ